MTYEKPYEIQFKHYPEYLHVIVKGKQDSSEISIAFWKEISEEFHKHGYKKVLVEEDFLENVSEVEIYEIGSAIAELFPYGLIAFYDHRIDQYSVNKFGETLVMNRGVIGKVFLDLEEARNWLLEHELDEFLRSKHNLNEVAEREDKERFLELALPLIAMISVLNLFT